MVNLITRLQGQAYSFFQSYTMEQCTDCLLLVAELKKKFIPVTSPAIRNNLFHDKTGCFRIIVAYAQELHAFFQRAYPVYNEEQKKRRHYVKQY